MGDAWRSVQRFVVPALTLSLLAFWTAPAFAQEGNRLFVAAGDGSERDGPYRGTATDAGLFGMLHDIAVRPDGGILFAAFDDGGVVLLVGPKGRIRRVAGRPDRFGFSGDGGRATEARLSLVSDIAVTADGGFLIGDNCRVRRVGPDGVIRTVAGSGRPLDCGPIDAQGPAPGDGGPATAATLREPAGVAVTADGGFLISEGNRVRRVDPGGTITTVAGTGGETTEDTPYGQPATTVPLATPHHLAPAPDGGFFVQDGYGVHHHVRSDGVIAPGPPRGTVVADNGTFYAYERSPRRIVGPLPSRSPLLAGVRDEYFLGWGDLTLRFGVSGYEDIEPMPGGGLVLADSLRIVVSAPATTRRLGVAIARETLPALLHRRLRFRLTRAARVELTLKRGRRVVLRRAASRKAGLSTIRLPRRTKRGLHHVRLAARSSDGAVATDSLRVLVGAWLPARVARRGITGEFFCFGECGGEQNRFRACRRFGPRRVDCVIATEDLDTFDVTRCDLVASAVLRRSGYSYLRPYGCRRRKGAGYFQGRPRYTGRARLAPPP